MGKELKFEVITTSKERMYVIARQTWRSAGLFSSKEVYEVERFEYGMFGGVKPLGILGEANDVQGIGLVIRSMITNVSKINAI